MAAGVLAEPGKGGGGFEAFLGRAVAGRADVQRITAVVFAEAGCRIDLQDLRHALPARQFAFEDAQLVIVAAVAGDRIERDAVQGGGALHGPPGARGARAQPQRATPAVEAGQRQPLRFGHQGQAAAPGVLGLVQPQCLQAFVQAFQWQLARCRWRSTPEAGVLLVEQVQGRTDAGFTRQPRDQRPQALVQHRGQVAAVTLAP